MDPRIEAILEFMRKKDANNEFSRQRAIITATRYREKYWFDLFPNVSTTWGVVDVFLARGFFKTSMIDQSAMLVHESVHQEQYKRLGQIQFWANYLAQHFAKGYDKNSFEVVAHKLENQWRLLAMRGHN